jgi:hypothetical protein
MGHILFWLEASVTSVLLFTLGLVISARFSSTRQNRGKGAAWFFVVILPLLVGFIAFLIVALWIYSTTMPVELHKNEPLFLGAIVAVACIVIAYIVILLGSRRGTLGLGWLPLLLLPWMVAVGILSAAHSLMGCALTPLISAAVAGALAIAAAVIVINYAQKPSPQTDVPIARTWRINRLALGSLAALLITGMTFWNLLLSVRREMDTMRVEARTIFNSVSPPRVPDSMNAAVLYKQAYEIMDQHENENRNWNQSVSNWLYDEKLFNPEDKEMLSFLNKHQPILKLLHEAAERPACNFGIEYTYPYIPVTLPPLNKMRLLNTFLNLSARVNTAHGDMSAAMKDLNAGFAVANHCTSEPMVIGTIVAAGMYRSSLKTFQYVLEHGDLSKDIFDTLHLNPYMNFNAILHRSIQRSKSKGLSVFTMRNPFLVTIGYEMKGIEEAAYRVFLWETELKSYLSTMSKYEELSSKPYHEHAKEWMRLSKIESKKREKLGLLAHAWMPPLSGNGEMAAEANAQYRLSLLAVAMLKYRFAEGNFPDKLEQLVPEYMLMLPIDPFTGKHLKMTKSDTQTIIYSVGPDLKDNGGQPWAVETTDISAKLGDIRFVLGK